MLNKIILHIGLPKAGSSSLQVNYLRHLEDKTHGYGGIWPLMSIGQGEFNMTETESLRYEKLRPLWRKYRSTCDPTLLHEIAIIVNKPTVILSNEVTTGAHRYYCPVPIQERISKIVAYFQQRDIEIIFLLCVRNPAKFLLSHYYDYPISYTKKNALGKAKVLSLEEWMRERFTNEEFVDTLRRKFPDKIQCSAHPYSLHTINLDDLQGDWLTWTAKCHHLIGLPQTLLPTNVSTNRFNYGVGELHVAKCRADSYSHLLGRVFSFIWRQPEKIPFWQFLNHRRQVISQDLLAEVIKVLDEV
jgi:hypothetical protein